MNYEDIFNKASFAALQCNKNRVRANQVNQLLSIFNTTMEEEIDYTIMLIMAFVMKQRERGYFGNESSGTIIETLETIMEEETKLDGDKVKKAKKKNVIEYLGLLKWFFEVANKVRVNWNANINQSFKSIVNDFKGSVSKKKIKN